MKKPLSSFKTKLMLWLMLDFCYTALRDKLCKKEE